MKIIYQKRRKPFFQNLINKFNHRFAKSLKYNNDTKHM